MNKKIATMIVASIFMVGCGPGPTPHEATTSGDKKPQAQVMEVITVRHKDKPLECVEVAKDLGTREAYYGLSCDWVGYHKGVNR